LITKIGTGQGKFKIVEKVSVTEFMIL